MEKNGRSNAIAAKLWSVADLLRSGGFKPSQYGSVILPFTLLRRLDCLLESTKLEVLSEYKEAKFECAEDDFLIQITGLSFYNTSEINLNQLSYENRVNDLELYIKSFSKNVLDIFKSFDFFNTIQKLNLSNLLIDVSERFASIDLGLDEFSNQVMGVVYSELSHRSLESSLEGANERLTPQDIVKLTTSLLFSGEKEQLSSSKLIKSLYDPTVGSGSFLSAAIEHTNSINPHQLLSTYGQDVSSESCAIAKARILLSGQEPNNIKLGNTLTHDQFQTANFDYIISNPPFGLSWQPFKDSIESENKSLNSTNRFKAGLPRGSDSTLLFIMHVISKLRPKADGGGRACVVVNSSCLFTGDANSGDSAIRRAILDDDLLEAIIALPENMFFNTSVQPYILVLTNKKAINRKNKVQLIDGSVMGLNSRKRVGMKNTYLDKKSITDLLEKYDSFKDGENCKVLSNDDFCYRQVKVGLSSRKFEYERVPLNTEIDTYLLSTLDDIHEGYEIDRSYIDSKDGQMGKLGVEFSFDLLSSDISIQGKEFRYFFQETDADDTGWDIAISKRWHQVVFNDYGASISIDKSKYNFFKFNVNFDIDYLKLFFQSEKWKLWLVTYRTNGVASSPQKYSTLRKVINFPGLKEQQEIALILNESSKWRKKLITLEQDLWREEKSDYRFERYRLPVDKGLHSRVLDVAPYPLANIMHHYGSISESDYKARYELLLKLFECLAIFSNSLALGFIEKELNQDAVLNILKTQKRYLKNATFGTWNNLLKLLKTKAENLPQESLLINIIFSEKLAKLFDDAVIIRNETSGHGSYPTKSAARDTFKLVDNLYLDFLDMFYDVFNDYCLVRPISGVWDGNDHAYELEEYSGLGSYPFGLKTLSSKTPFVNEELYFVSSQNNEDKLKVFPFVRLIDLEEDSGLEAFYFYSKVQENDATNTYEFLFISHQQVHKQKQLHTANCIEAIYS